MPLREASPSSGPSSRPFRVGGLAPVLGLAVLFALVGAVRAGDDPGEAGGAGADGAVEAALAWEAEPLFLPRLMFLPLEPEVPKDLAPPPGVEPALGARIRWGEGRGLSFLVETAPGAARLWIDRDLDFRLDGADAASKESVAWGSGTNAVQRELEVAVVYADEEARVPVRFMRAAVWDLDRVRIMPWVHRFGHVELEGRLRPVALTDGNADLRFGEDEHDAAFLDLDGDGELDVRAEGGERIDVGVPFRLGERGWILEVPARSGARVRFRPSPEVPPARPRAWRPVGRMPAGYRPTPPDEPLAQVLERIEAERAMPYARRYQAINLLGLYGTPEAFARLARLAGDDADDSVRAAAVRAMGNAAFLEAGGARVVQLTGDPTPAIAMAAADALHRMDHPDREAVYRRLLDKAPDAVAGRAAANLALLDTPTARAAVEKAWKTVSVGSVRLALYQGLRSAEGGPDVEVAREAAADDYAPLRSQALEDLRLLDPPAALELARDAALDRPVQITLGRTLIDLLAASGGGEDVRLLLALVPDLPATLETHLASRLALLRGAGAVEALVDALADRDARLRALAAATLAHVVRPEVTRALLSRVRREKDDAVLAVLLEAIGDHGDDDAVQVLLKKTRTRDDAVRRAAIRALARVGMGDERARAALLKLLDARDWEDRVLAVDAVAASGEARLAPKLLPLMEDDAWQVRLAAVQAAGTLRAPSVVPALIERLEEEPEDRVRGATAQALFRITHQHFYDDARVWRDWWAKQGPDYAPPEGLPPETSREPGHTGPGFYGIPVDSSRVVFVIDQSGSMSAPDAGGEGRTRLQTALSEVLKAVQAMGDRDRVNVILFHTTVHPWRDGLERLTKKNRHDLAAHLDGQQPMGGTNLYDALEMALLAPDVDTVLLLSDGAPGVGRYVAKDDILRAVRRLNQTRRIRIHTISLGTASALMEALAKENAGVCVTR